MIDTEAIPGLMGAMTMPYKLAQPGIASELHPGDHVTARLRDLDLCQRAGSDRRDRAGQAGLQAG